MPAGESLSPGYFERLYTENPDPWGFETRAYEREKYATTLAALPRTTYHNALEIGCSIGVLTEQLAGRCGALRAVDVSETALQRARQRCARLPHVRLERRQLPGEFPTEQYDLILVSEVGYYWSAADLVRARQAITDGLRPGGHLLLVHWTPYVADYPLTGDAVHEAFLAVPDQLRHQFGQRHATYRLDRFERTEG
ncbi:MAG: methyltransferase domain-containing protein [Ferruginibacter sp.]|nr:methyltransferase domain-containing protein [Cytophagales bacterium]